MTEKKVQDTSLNKAQAFDQLASLMHRHYASVCAEIRTNKYEIKALAKNQAILKRKRAELHELQHYCYQRKKLEEDSK